MRRFLFGALTMPLCAALAHGDEEPPVTDLAKVIAHPMAYDGRVFEGYVYVDNWSTFHFVPYKTLEENERIGSDATLLIGGDAQKLSRKHYHDGDRIKLRGKLEVDRPCFNGSFCVPFSHPIFLNNPKVVK